MTIGKRISELRKAKGYTQEYIAEQLGVSRQAVSKWESGASYPSTENLLKFSTLLEVPVNEILLIQENEMTNLEAYAYQRLRQDMKREETVRFLLKQAAQIGLMIGLYGLIYCACYFFNYMIGHTVYNFSWLCKHHVLPITCALTVVMFLLDRPLTSIGLCIGTIFGILLGHIVGWYAHMTSNVGWNNAWIVHLAAFCLFGFLGLALDKQLTTGRPWNKVFRIVFTVVVAVAVFITAYVAAVHMRKVYGANCGYDDGYGVGQYDAAQGYAIYTSSLCITPPDEFTFGDPAYDGYMIYWPSGYWDGYYGVNVPKT